MNLDTCPNCGGPADNGFDRSWPEPEPYFCTKCNDQQPLDELSRLHEELDDEPTPAAVGLEPVATLHDDGCFTWKRDEFRLRYDRQRAGWRMDVYAADTGYEVVLQSRITTLEACWSEACSDLSDSQSEVAALQEYVTLIRNQTLDEIASKMAGFTWFDGDDAAEEIRSMKT